VDDVGVDAEGDGRVGVAEAGFDDVDGDARQEQRGGVDVSKIVKAGVGARRSESAAGRQTCAFPDHAHVHQSRVRK
jgi:hypothetical protein